MKYSKIAAVAAAVCLLLAACQSGTGDDSKSDTGSYRILYMPSYPSADKNENETGNGSGSGNGNTTGLPDVSSPEVDDGRQQVVSAQTVSSAGEIKTQREALDLVKNRVMPIRFKNIPAMEYKDGKNGATGKYTGTMERKQLEPGASGSVQVYVAVEAEGPEFFRVVYYSETPINSGGGRNTIEYLASYQVYRDGRVKDIFQGEFIGIKE